jgi:NAD-dependent deacetylase
MEISKKFIDILSKAGHVAVLTGAGVSAESGIKTFRDPDGLWTKFYPQELASVSGFMANPKLVWEW